MDIVLFSSCFTEQINLFLAFTDFAPVSNELPGKIVNEGT